MGLPINIDDTIRQRLIEPDRLEYCEEFDPLTILHSLCAFANDIDNIGGGYILIGVAGDNGAPRLPVTGIAHDRIDGILKQLHEYCHLIEPFYEPVAEPVLYEGNWIIVIWAAGGYGRPYKAPQEIGVLPFVKWYYIRKLSRSVIASPEEEKELFYISSNIPFDDRPNLAASVADLDVTLMREYLREIGSSMYERATTMDTLALARDMQLFEGPPERLRPRNVGILMFSRSPQKYFRYARLEIVDIPHPSGKGMTEKVFTGPIQRQLMDALAFLKNYSLQSMTTKINGQAEANVVWNYPYEAVEEILSNAVYHRSYQSNEPITVRITPEGMEITSFPGFDRSISDEDVARVEIRGRIYRNRRIGDFLKELKLIEGRNTGFPNACHALLLNGSPKLRFAMNAERDYLAVTIPVHEAFLPKTGKIEKIRTYNERLLTAIGDNTFTITELSKALGYKRVSQKLRTAVQGLLNKGVLETVQQEGRINYQKRI